jgi:hypothetical protein
MAVMDEATTKPFRAISHATKPPLLNIGTVSFERVVGYARLVLLPHASTPIDRQATVSATAICAAAIDAMSVLGLQAVVLVVHAALPLPHVVALGADGGDLLGKGLFCPWIKSFSTGGS